LEELSEKIGIPSSSIQRYLNDPLVETIFGEDTHRRIKET